MAIVDALAHKWWTERTRTRSTIHALLKAEEIEYVLREALRKAGRLPKPVAGATGEDPAGIRDAD